MTFLSSSILSDDSDFRKKIKVAIAKVATDIIGESSSGDPTKDVRRKELGIAILNNPADYVERFANTVVSDLSLTSASTDNDIELAINTVFDDIAGVS